MTVPTIRRLPAAAPFAAELQRLIGDPQMAALLQANPGMARLLRPLCRMLGVQQPPEQRVPRPPLPGQPADEPRPEQFSPAVPPQPQPSWRAATHPPDPKPQLA